MLSALVRDLARVRGVQPVVACDPEIALDGLPAHRAEIDVDRIWESWRKIIGTVDAVWPIAPETDGCLERAVALAQNLDRAVFSSRAEALATARSKTATAERLSACGVPSVACAPLDGDPPVSTTGWVVKPDDGAGSTETYAAADRDALDLWRRRLAGRNFIVQPFIPGAPLSLSLLVQDGAAWLLACNTQQMRCDDGAFAYDGGIVGGAEARRPSLERIAAGVAAAVPGLWGHIGVDLIDGRDGPMVLEINPRLTTPYVGLGESIGINPAGLVLALRSTKLATLVHPLTPRPVDVSVPKPS